MNLLLAIATLARVENSSRLPFILFQLTASALCGLQTLICGYFAYRLYRRRRDKLARSQRLPGEILEFREVPSKDGPIKHPIVRYTAANGEQTVFESSFGSSYWRKKPGDRVTVLFDPMTPDQPEIQAFSIQWLIPVFLASASLGGFYGLWLLKGMVG